MGLTADLRMYARYAGGLPRFLRHTISLNEARTMVRRRLEQREASFLNLAERGIYRYSKSPYLPMLRLARCELGDIRNLIRSSGLENTLQKLREAGVYVTFEEMKCRERIVRSGAVIPVSPQDFDNPYLSGCYQSESGGTTGAGTRVSIDLEHLAAQASHQMLTCEAHGVLRAPTALWRGILPDGSGLQNILRGARFGNLPQKWFSPVISDDLRPSKKYRLANQGTVLIGRLCGVPIPWPEQVRLEEAIVVARWATETVKRHGSCLVIVPVSRALRVCLAAEEEGLDLQGITFMIAGEPLTPAKVRGITVTGAHCFPTYGFAEAGRVAMGCARPSEASDLHFFRDAFALIQFPRTVPGTDATVPAFNFTSLLPTAPKLMLNMEIDDYGVVERRPCGCLLEECGFTEHLRDIYSYRKLTGEGVTLVGGEMIRILEEVLPARFGGSPLDYQLMEEEDERGFTRLSLLVSPKVGAVEEDAVIQTVLGAMAGSSVAADSARAIWKQAGSLRVKRREPVWTARGKLMPLHLTRRAPEPGDRSRQPYS